MTNISNQALERLAQLATRLFFPKAKKVDAESLQSSLAKAIRRSLRILPDAEAEAVAELDAASATGRQRPPPGAKRLLLRLVGLAGLLDWALKNRPPTAPKMSADELGRKIVK